MPILVIQICEGHIVVDIVHSVSGFARDVRAHYHIHERPIECSTKQHYKLVLRTSIPPA